MKRKNCERDYKGIHEWTFRMGTTYICARCGALGTMKRGRVTEAI